jgi:hypothetical protein
LRKANDESRRASEAEWRRQEAEAAERRANQVYNKVQTILEDVRRRSPVVVNVRTSEVVLGSTQADSYTVYGCYLRWREKLRLTDSDRKWREDHKYYPSRRRGWDDPSVPYAVLEHDFFEIVVCRRSADVAAGVTNPYSCFNSYGDCGQGIYRLRKCIVEPVIGVIKAVLGFRQLSLRGLEAADGEWALVCLAFNLKRMHALALA